MSEPTPQIDWKALAGLLSPLGRLVSLQTLAGTLIGAAVLYVAMHWQPTEPEPILPAQVTARVGEYVAVQAHTSGSVQWIIHGNLTKLPEVLDGGRKIYLKGDAVGVTKIHCIALHRSWLPWGTPKADLACTDFTVGDVPPGPTPPVPPDPGPVPVPGAFRAVLVPHVSMTAQQQAGMDSPEVRGYLDSHCLNGKAGWKRWLADTDSSALPEWDAMWTQAKSKLPQGPAIVVFRGTTTDIKPLPADKAAILALLKSYGG